MIYPPLPQLAWVPSPWWRVTILGCATCTVSCTPRLWQSGYIITRSRKASKIYGRKCSSCCGPHGLWCIRICPSPSDHTEHLFISECVLCLWRCLSPLSKMRSQPLDCCALRVLTFGFDSEVGMADWTIWFGLIVFSQICVQPNLFLWPFIWVIFVRNTLL